MILSDPKKKLPISLVLLVHNEAEVIETVIRGFYEKVISKLPGSEIVVAEDGSTDGTKEILHGLCREISEIRLEEGREKRGYTAAFKRALGLAKHELILFCDASGKHDSADFWRMAEAIEDADMVVGYKVNRQDPFYRLVLTRIFNWLVNRYFGVSFRDANCPLRLMRKTAFLEVAKVPWLQKGLINFEITVRMVKMGFRVKEVPVKHFARKAGPSRGLPVRTIPRTVLQTLRNFPAIKRSLKHNDTAATYNEKHEAE